MFQFSYGIMADRGIMVQYPFANLDVYVNTPTMLSERSQLEPNRLVKYSRMTFKRIHIDRIRPVCKLRYLGKYSNFAQWKI